MEGSRPGSGARRIDPPSVVNLAVAAIRDMILSGELRSGDRLVEERLGELLGVSRPPLREALRALEREGVVTITPRRGAHVTPMTARDAYEIFTLRGTLERLAVELGLPVTDPARLERCRRAIAAMSEHAHDEDRAGFTRAAFEFHLSVVALAGHRRLEQMYASLQLQVQLYVAENAADRHETRQDSIASHRQLLELIESGDAEALLRLLAAHGDRTLLDQLAEQCRGS